MADVTAAPSRPGLLHYRPWQGTLRPPQVWHVPIFLAAQTGILSLAALLDDFPLVRLFLCIVFMAGWGLVVKWQGWPIARSALVMMFRRRLFWAMYALALLVFLLFFFGQYLMLWAETQMGEGTVAIGRMGRANPKFLVDIIRNALKLNGSAETFRNFFRFEASTVMIVLALAGALLVGNDLRFGSLPFYLSKPISRWDYLLGKGLAVAIFLNLFTTVPGVVLWAQYGLLESWDYFLNEGHLLVGILAFGMVLSVSLTLILLATAVWVRKTVPMIMVWTTLFVFLRRLSESLVDGLHFDARWRMIDLYGSVLLLGSHCLRMDPSLIRPIQQPEWYEVAGLLAVVNVACLAYLIQRIRAVEIVQ